MENGVEPRAWGEVASVDHTEAPHVADSDPDVWGLRRGGHQFPPRSDTNSPLSEKSVLIVIRFPAIRQGLSVLFDYYAGWTSCCAGTLKEAVAALESRPDCVVTCLRLPDGRGEDVVRRVRELGYPCRVVVLSADDYAPRIAALKVLGVDAVLTQPASSSELLRACRIEEEQLRGSGFMDPKGATGIEGQSEGSKGT